MLVDARMHARVNKVNEVILTVCSADPSVKLVEQHRLFLHRELDEFAKRAALQAHSPEDSIALVDEVPRRVDLRDLRDTMHSVRSHPQQCTQE